jgi:cyclic pyranopterin phosphate synthase
MFIGQVIVPPHRSEALGRIQERLREHALSLAQAIEQRELYFRVSVVGTCNLSCTFCHNEGASTQGKLTLESLDRAVAAAVRIGFRRVQLTGGEPLLRPDIADFVSAARRHVSDVGVTTNGTYLPQRLNGLLHSGLSRLHVSLQAESLDEAGGDGKWGLPDWLQWTVERTQGTGVNVRFNLPVHTDRLVQAEPFLDLLTSRGIDVKVFSVLPEGQVRSEDYPLEQLEAVVDRVNTRSDAMGGAEGRAFIRGFLPPSGLRCGTCGDRSRCKEQSHSLRLGADLRLRPCLATRTWDSDFSHSDPDSSIREAALLALDYRW